MDVRIEQKESEIDVMEKEMEKEAGKMVLFFRNRIRNKR